MKSKRLGWIGGLITCLGIILMLLDTETWILSDNIINWAGLIPLMAGIFLYGKCAVAEHKEKERNDENRINKV